jgi:DNA-binding MarR family transcriptional regulator
VWRHPHPSSRRWRWVRLTDEGRGRLAAANSELMGPHSIVDTFVQNIVTHDPDNLRARRLGYSAATTVTDTLRARLDDRATLRYPLYPEPGEPWPPPVTFPLRLGSVDPGGT